jgi:hypothetical protein
LAYNCKNSKVIHFGINKSQCALFLSPLNCQEKQLNKMLVMFMLALETEIDFQILTTLEAKGFLGLRQPFLWPGFVVLAILRRRKQFA